MPYLQLRITLDPSGNRDRPNVKRLLKSFRSKWLRLQDNVAHTCGYELLNKFGEPCDPHFHFNAYFDPPDLKDPLRSARNWLRREASAYDFSLKGNKQWSCTMVEEPKDYQRWIRYPLKETGIHELCSMSKDVSGNTPPEYLQLMRDAFNERKRSIELNVLKREKLADKVTFKDKLFSYLDEVYSTFEGALLTDKQVWISILQFYQEQGKCICLKTISGYSILYRLHQGSLTVEQAYDLR